MSILDCQIYSSAEGVRGHGHFHGDNDLPGILFLAGERGLHGLLHPTVAFQS